MAVAIITLFTSMMITCYALHRYPIIYKDLGMTELPLPASLVLAWIEAFKRWWWIVGAVSLVLAALSWKGRLGRTGWMPVGMVFMLAVAFPVVAQFAVEMPLVQLQRALRNSK